VADLLVAKHLFSFNRSPTWITPEFGDNLDGVNRSTVYTPEQKKLWAANPSELLKFRRKFKIDINQFTDASYKGSPAQKAAFKYITKDMKAKLAKKPELFDQLIPKFAVGCRRFSPGQGYLEALVEDNVTVKTEQISMMNEKGIAMKHGSLIDLDAIICATGFDTSHRPVFPLIAYGKDLRDVWESGPRGYLSVAASGFPNYFSRYHSLQSQKKIEAN
jgi:cation diffusion facilitator CzcD-associated flavoprotein CzcO